MTMTAQTQETTLKTLDSIRSTLDESEQSSYDASVQKYGANVNAVWGWLGLGGSASYSKEQINQAMEHKKTEGVDVTHVQNLLHSMETQTVEVKGTISATGTSFVPTTGYVFIQIVVTTFSDGSSTQSVASDTPTVADENGKVVAQTNPSSTINIIPVEGSVMLHLLRH